jgi:hypothetical protein
LTPSASSRKIGIGGGKPLHERDKGVISKLLLARLLTGALLLPAAIVLVVAVAGLLSGMNDAGGAYVMNRVALGLGIVWILELIALLLALALNSLQEFPTGEGSLSDVEPDFETGDGGTSSQ